MPLTDKQIRAIKAQLRSADRAAAAEDMVSYLPTYICKLVGSKRHGHIAGVERGAQTRIEPDD